MLVDHRGHLRGLACADHRVLQCGAALGGEGVARVAEVVEAEVLRQADLGAGPRPLPTEGGSPERRSLLPTKSNPSGLLLREPVVVPLDLDVEEGPRMDGAHTGRGLSIAGILNLTKNPTIQSASAILRGNIFTRRENGQLALLCDQLQVLLR